MRGTSRGRVVAGDRTPAVQLRRIVERLPDAIVIVSREGRMRFANPAAEALFGRPRDQLIGHEFGAPVVAGETAEIDIVRPGGQTVTAELRVVDLAWEDEEALLVALRDITDRKHAEERGRQLAAAEAARAQAEAAARRAEFLDEAVTLLNSTFDTGHALSSLVRMAVPILGDWCLIVTQQDGTLRCGACWHVDPARREPLGALCSCLATDPLDPHPIARVLRSRTAELHPIFTPTLESVGDENCVRLLREIGTTSMIAVPLVAREAVLGAVACGSANRRFDDAALALSREFAERVALSIANGMLLRQAQQASRAKSDFLAVMSHELRTPLNVIDGYTDLLDAELGGPLTEKQREQLQRIKSNSRHLLQLVEEILTFSRMEAGKEEVRRRRVELTPLLHEVAREVEPLAKRKQLSLVVHPPDDGAALVTDPGKVRQILLNLLSNAVKFTDAGEIRLEAHPDGDTAELVVSDTGIGIPEEHLGQIFEPFWQVEQSSRREVGGTGLGLSVAERLARLLGGELRVRSAVGKGTTFTLHLPAAGTTGEEAR